MNLRAIPFFEKLPAEEFTQQVTFAAVLVAGETILSATVTAIDRSTGDSASAILSGSPSVSGGNAVNFDLVGGTLDTNYLIDVVATLNTGDKREQWIEMRVPKKTRP